MNHVIEKFEHLKVPLEAINSATDNFADKNCIGRGGFGKVYKAQLLLSGALTTVALKRLDPKFGQGNPEFWKEIITLSLYKHQNIVSLLGFCDECGEKILVYEYASRGSLDLYLDSNDLNWIQRLKICIGAARGLAYLHKPGETYQRVLHRDIKSSNILLDENWNARIADLGLCKFGPANQQYTFLVSNTVGTIGYCDPLYVESGLLTKESDVYSFGVVLFEVLCGRLSISNSGDKRQPLTGLVRQYYEQNNMGDLIHANLKDEITSRSLEEFTAIAYPCLSTDLKKRPKMAKVVISLERALQYQAEAGESMQYGDMVGNMRMPDSEHEANIGNVGLPSLDSLDINDGFEISSLQIISDIDLEELKQLDFGTFGTVYHGKWRGTDVAIEKHCFTGRSSDQERHRFEFWREATILSNFHHPNVVGFYGVVQDGPGGTLATVTEFMVDGSVRGVLLRKDGHLDHRKKLIIAMHAAFGMEHVHSKNIVHFDLKCDNLFVNMTDPTRPISKVGGFGLAKIKRNTLVSGGVRGTLPWMAPELLNGSGYKVSEKVDVFSFGIVLWEILTGEEPYANMHYGAILGGIVNDNLRPPVPTDCDLEWRRLMEQCWDPDPVVRPSFTKITGKLHAMSTIAALGLS